MAKRRRYKTDAIDTLSARLTQAGAALLAVRMTFEDGPADGGSILANHKLRDALWGISEQIDQAEAAFDRMQDDWQREREQLLARIPLEPKTAAEKRGLLVIAGKPNADGVQ